jgi:putative hydrolase of the HAD superfamily
VTEKFDALLFDAGGIFVLPDPATIGMVVEQLGGSGDMASMVRAHYAGMAALDHLALERESGSIDKVSWDTYRRAVAMVSGIPAERGDEAVIRLRDMYSPMLWRWPILESASALWRLHLKGVPIGVVSNASGQIEATLANQCILQVGPGAGVPVLIVTDSHIVGHSKPDARIFDDAIAVLEARGIERSRVAYVGDSYVNDVGAARNAGMTGVLLDPYDDRLNFDCKRVRSLHELMEMV